MSAPADELRPVLDWLAGQEQAMLAVLERIVNIDSNSYDKAGIDKVGAELIRHLEGAGIPVTVEPLPANGDIIRAELAAANGANAPGFLLMGHRDTVFPTGTAAQRPFRIADGRAYGPGVADMKSGLVMNLFVMMAFARFGALPRALVCLFTGDEEIASPASRPFIEREARRSALVLNAEPGRANGNVVTERRACIFITVEVEGVAAHSGVNFDQGRSAIGELAHKIIALHGLTDLSREITVNVGLISGGEAVNMVAPHAKAEVDLRYFALADRDELLAAVAGVLETTHMEGTRTTWALKGEFPPLNRSPASDRLFEIYHGHSVEVGLPAAAEKTGGAADSGFTAAVGTPSLCGTGPVGGGAHSVREYLEVASLVPRSLILARTLHELAHTDLRP